MKSFLKRMRMLALMLMSSMMVIHPPSAQAYNPPKATPPVDWPVYPAGKMPFGKIMTQAEAAKYPNRGEFKEVRYLVGTFTVTSTGKDRAVLRAHDDLTGPEIRVLVMYPPAIPVPAEGTKVVRDETRGFLITDVRRGNNGQVTIYVRDITIP